MGVQQPYGCPYSVFNLISCLVFKIKIKISLLYLLAALAKLKKQTWLFLWLCTHSPSPFSDLVSSLRWVKDGKEFTEEMDHLGMIRANESKDMKFYHGKYRCYASNELGTAESDLIELNTEREFFCFSFSHPFLLLHSASWKLLARSD